MALGIDQALSALCCKCDQARLVWGLVAAGGMSLRMQWQQVHKLCNNGVWLCCDAACAVYQYKRGSRKRARLNAPGLNHTIVQMV
jgi:hypothetical protein